MAPATDARAPDAARPGRRRHPGRWPVWKLGLLLAPFVAAAVAINLFLLALMAPVVGIGALSPVDALLWALPLAVPATWWSARQLRALMDQADADRSTTRPETE